MYDEGKPPVRFFSRSRILVGFQGLKYHEDSREPRMELFRSRRSTIMFDF